MSILDVWNGNDDASEERRQREAQEAAAAARIQRSKDSFARAGGSGMGVHPGMIGAANMTGQGMANHAAAAGQINAAIGGEMQSRVAQQREMRRMEHEKEMMRMRIEAQKKDSDGNMIRALLNG